MIENSFPWREGLCGPCRVEGLISITSLHRPTSRQPMRTRARTRTSRRTWWVSKPRAQVRALLLTLPGKGAGAALPTFFVSKWNHRIIMLGKDLEDHQISALKSLSCPCYRRNFALHCRTRWCLSGPCWRSATRRCWTNRGRWRISCRSSLSSSSSGGKRRWKTTRYLVKNCFCLTYPVINFKILVKRHENLWSRASVSWVSS